MSFLPGALTSHLSDKVEAISYRSFGGAESSSLESTLILGVNKTFQELWTHSRSKACLLPLWILREHCPHSPQNI